jgi:hypothetical protein
MHDAEPLDDEPIDLVTTVGQLDEIVATLRDALHRSGALRFIAAVDQDPPAIVDAGRLTPIEVRTEERTVHLPHAIELDANPLCPDLHLAQVPPFEADPVTGEVICTLGGLDMLADAVSELARTFGGESVVICQYQTVTPDQPLAITARTGEPVLVTIGEAEFELPPRDERT